MTFAFIGMNAFVIHRTHWGVAGLAGATSLAAAMHAASMYWVLRKRMRGLASPAMAISAAKIALSTGVLCLAAAAIDQLCNNLTGDAKVSLLSAFLHTTLPGLTATIVYLVAAWALRMPEAATAIALFRRRKAAAA